MLKDKAAIALVDIQCLRDNLVVGAGGSREFRPSIEPNCLSPGPGNGVVLELAGGMEEILYFNVLGLTLKAPNKNCRR